MQKFMQWVREKAFRNFYRKVAMQKSFFRDQYGLIGVRENGFLQILLKGGGAETFFWKSVF